MKIKKPKQHSVTIRTKVGEDLVAECRRRRTSFSSFMDALAEQCGKAILEGRIIQLEFKWPQPWGMR